MFIYLILTLTGPENRFVRFLWYNSTLESAVILSNSTPENVAVATAIHLCNEQLAVLRDDSSHEPDTFAMEHIGRSTSVICAR
jgi:hypothetical protein